MEKTGKHLLMLVVYGLLPYIAKNLLENSKIDTDNIAKETGENLMKLPRPAMMVLMAVPEQLVMMHFEPNMPLVQRLLVSVAMYVIHFAWNGMVMKPERSYNELVWIVGTALYALNVLGVKQSTAIALVAADSVMTLALRGLA
jgi:hypothetical protein